MGTVTVAETALSGVTIADVKKAQSVIAEHVSAVPLVRSYALEKELGLTANRRVWLKDYGWTPVGSFKLLGAQLDGGQSGADRRPSRRGTLLGELRVRNCLCGHAIQETRDRRHARDRAAREV